MTTTKSTLIAVKLAGDGGIFGGAFHKIIGTVDTQSSETVQTKTQIITAFTWQDLGFQLTGTGAVTTFKSRNNGSAGNQTISSTLNTPGWYTDSTHTDSVSANTPIDINRSTNNGPTVTLVSSTIAASSPLSIQGSNSSGGSASFSTTKQYGYVNGSIQIGTTETDLQVTVRAAGTWKNTTLAINGSPTNAVTFTVRKNTADGNQTIAVSGGTAANMILSDTTHTDSIAANDLIAQSAVQVTAGSGSMRWCSSEFIGTTSAQDVGAQADTVATSSLALAASTSYYWALGGQPTTNTTEVNAKYHTPYAFTLSKVRTRIYTNTSSTMTLKSRVNGADGNATVSVSSGTTGILEDTTHTDSVSATNDVNFTGVTGSVTTLGLKYVYATMDDGTVSGVVNLTLTSAQGTYAETGVAAALKVASKVTAAQGTYTETGVAAGVRVTTRLTAVKGVYALTGISAGLNSGARLTANQGSYTLSGVSAGFRAALRLTAVQGTYVLSGQTAVLKRGLFLVASAGGYHLTGQATSSHKDLVLHAHRGHYRVHRQRTILRIGNTSQIVFPVDTGDYILNGESVVLGRSVYRYTFSAFTNTDLVDWDSADYVSTLDTNYVIPDGLNFAWVPYVYVFLASGTEDSDGVFLQVNKDWATDGTIRDGTAAQVYRFRDGYSVAVSKNRVRGKGRSFQLKFHSDGNKDFNLRGWGIWLDRNS